MVGMGPADECLDRVDLAVRDPKLGLEVDVQLAVSYTHLTLPTKRIV